MSVATAPADEAMLSTYEELSDRLLERYDTEKDSLKNNQLFVGIGGGPGSGKSTLASAVRDRVNSKRPGAAVVLTMDGFHFSRAELREMGELGKVIGDPESTTGDSTTFTDLIARRGAPWTFDAPAVVREFSRVRNDGFGSLPVYSRQKSDPIPDGVELKSSHQIVLLEGNYLLCHSDPEWAALNKLFDEKWFIICESLEAQRERLALRHLETWTEEKTNLWGGGKTGAVAKADANDMKNAIWVDDMSRGHADQVISSK